MKKPRTYSWNNLGKHVNKTLKHYEDLCKLNNLNRVKAIKHNGEIYLPKNVKVLVTTKDKNSKAEIILKAKEMGIPIMTPEEWESSLLNKQVEVKKTICFTGDMPEKRSYYEDVARNNGFDVVSSVTSNLSLLITANELHTSSKVDKAKSYNISILTLEQFLRLVFN